MLFSEELSISVETSLKFLLKSPANFTDNAAIPAPAIATPLPKPTKDPPKPLTPCLALSKPFVLNIISNILLNYS